MPTTPPGKVGDLEALARARFGDLTEAELRLLRAAPKGEWAWCGPSQKDDDPANDPSKADKSEDQPGWGLEREIRGELIRWLYVDPRAAEKIDPRGVRVQAAKITGKLDLSYVTAVFPLRLCRCRLSEDANLIGAHIPEVLFSGGRVCSIEADRLHVIGSVFLDEGSIAEGEVSLVGAQIGGNLECEGSKIWNPGRNALNGDGIHVGGDIYLNDGFSAKGEVRLIETQIGGNLECQNGEFRNESADALSVDHSSVTGNIFLRDGFRAEGQVRLVGTQVSGDLNCRCASFSQLNAQRATIKGNFFWSASQNASAARLDLTNATAGAIVDDMLSWPEKGNLSLDGFTYNRFSEGPRDANSRLDWLSRQEKFTPQPYRQLANVLHETGDERGSHEALFEMERLRREQGNPKRYERVWSWLLRWTIGYGHKTWRALICLLGLAAIGFVLSGLGYLSGAMAPSQKDVFEVFNETGATPAYYPRFNAAAFSLEHSFPFIDLGERNHWAPAPGGSRRAPVLAWPAFQWLRDFHVGGIRPFRLNAPRFLRVWLWFQIAVGWILATLFVAGLTGVVKSR